jgi:hypothetical protein
MRLPTISLNKKDLSIQTSRPESFGLHLGIEMPRPTLEPKLKQNQKMTLTERREAK